MSSSGTYAFAPSAGDLILNSFGMIGIRRWELTQQHLVDAGLQANLQMVDFSNRNPNRWAMETQDVSLTQGNPTYSLTDRTLAIAIAYISTTSGSTVTDRVIGPLSATDYASMPIKLQQGPPTSYFFSLLTPTPTVSVWPCPDANGPYTLKLQTFRQMQDVALPSGIGLDSPYRFLDAFSKGLAYRLGLIYPPQEPGKMDRLKVDFGEAFGLAAGLDQESTPMYVRPILSGYFR